MAVVRVGTETPDFPGLDNYQTENPLCLQEILESSVILLDRSPIMFLTIVFID